jgi:hypothetical protein
LEPREPCGRGEPADPPVLTPSARLVRALGSRALCPCPWRSLRPRLPGAQVWGARDGSIPDAAPRRPQGGVAGRRAGAAGGVEGRSRRQGARPGKTAGWGAGGRGPLLSKPLLNYSLTPAQPNGHSTQAVWGWKKAWMASGVHQEQAQYCRPLSPASGTHPATLAESPTLLGL